MTARVLIGAGHHNTSGGNDFERVNNGNKVHAIIDNWRNRGGAEGTGIDLRCYTPGDGLGMYPGTLDAAIISGFTPTWTPHVACEIHSEGVTDALVRGCFVIYPDTGTDVDKDVKANGTLFTTGLSKDTNGAISVRGTGLMSERATGVGLEGWRLGVFSVTARYAETCTRFIFEQGAHSNPAERAYMETDEFLRTQASSFIVDMIAFVDRIMPGVRVPTTPPTPLVRVPLDEAMFAKGNVNAVYGHYDVYKQDGLHQTVNGVLSWYSPGDMTKRKNADHKAMIATSLWINNITGDAFFRSRKGWFWKVQDCEPIK